MAYVVPAEPVVGIPVVGSADVFPVRRVYCVGRNYAEHAREMGSDPDREPPFFFCKPADAVMVVPDGKTGELPYPSLTKNFHFEMELVVAIGKAGRDIPLASANEHVWGYALGLDMTRRDLQGEMKKGGRPWEIGKAFDLSAPIGPMHPVTRTGIITKGAIWLKVNDAIKQTSDIDQLIWNIPETIANLSTYFELKPGDLIYSGTPAGVGAVKPGDLMVGSVDGLGELRVRVA